MAVPATLLSTTLPTAMVKSFAQAPRAATKTARSALVAEVSSYGFFCPESSNEVYKWIDIKSLAASRTSDF